MNIYLIRHGDAEKASLNKKDFDRELTESGQVKIKNAAEGWTRIIPIFDEIITSPFIRAKQTAKLIADVFSHEKGIIIDNVMLSGSNTKDFIAVANSFEGENLAFIGHQPDCSDHLSNLISNSGLFVDFSKGMIAKISFNNKVRFSKGTLEFLLPAELFNKKG